MLLDRNGCRTAYLVVYVIVTEPMTISILGSQGKPNKSSSSEDMKPLVREYGKKNPEIYTESHNILRGKLSSSREWCILECEEYSILMKTSCQAVEDLYNNILPHVHGKKANALVSVPVKKNKFGAVIGVDSEQSLWYSYDAESMSFELTESKPVDNLKKQGGLTLSMFIDTQERDTSLQETKDSNGEDKDTSGANKRTRKLKE
jgi:hypothetical protein